MRRIQLSRSGLLVAVILLVGGSSASFGLGQSLARQAHAAAVTAGLSNKDQRSGPIVSLGGGLGRKPGEHRGSHPGSGGRGRGESNPTPAPSNLSGQPGSGVSVTQSGSGQTITVNGDGASVTITQSGSGTSISVISGQSRNAGQSGEPQGHSQGWAAAHTTSCSPVALGATRSQNARAQDSGEALVVSAGSAVPVHLRIRGPCAGAGSLAARLYLAPMDGGGFIPALSADGAASNAFRYDAGRGEYRYDVGTQGLPRGAYRLGIDLGNGQLYVVPFAVR
jgi:hypothetical protein